MTELIISNIHGNPITTIIRTVNTNLKIVMKDIKPKRIDINNNNSNIVSIYKRDSCRFHGEYRGNKIVIFSFLISNV